MKQNRRQFISKSVLGLAAMAVGPRLLGRELFDANGSTNSKPWLELSKAAYLHNAAQISRMAGGKPVIAVLKNNAYGLGDVQVARILNDSPHIAGMAVVKDDTALAMREGGITKPILLMGDFDSNLASSLVEKKITLSIFSQASLGKIVGLANNVDKTVDVALYIDTGLGRMGIPYEETISIADEIAKNERLTITQTFSTLTTPKDFAEEQIRRFEGITTQLESKGIAAGLKHLAPSYSLLDLPNSHQQAVRPGILLHGSFPLAKMEQAKQYPLKVTYRLKAAVIRLEKLKAGDTIGFSRFYKVEKDEWIATLPVGWADGYYAGAENGAMVLLGDKLHRVVNVNASHANVSLGEETNVKVGDVATLIGPEYPELTPEGFGKLAGGHNYLQIYYKEYLPKKIYETF